jgi:tetratricopeptide (TPR) repeat protein
MLEIQGRYREAVSMRRRELVWMRQHKGDTDEGTLSSINALAIDLRETGELQESEMLFRELVNGQMKTLRPEDIQIGRALGGLAITLELTGKLDEALQHRQASLEHRLEHRGVDDYWSNQARLKTAELLYKLKRSGEALQLLEELVASMSVLDELDGSDRQLIDQAKLLSEEIRSSKA